METTDTEEHFFLCYYLPSFSFFVRSALHTVFLPGFRTLGSTGPIKKLKGVIREKSRSQSLGTVNSMFSQVRVLDNDGYFLNTP